jgi:plastocyanin
MNIGYPEMINLLHILLVGPLLVAIGSDKIPDYCKPCLVVLGILIIVYHLYVLFTRKQTEGLVTKLNGSNIHYVKMFDASPGYDIPNLAVKIGDIVVWTNVGELEHSVTSSTGDFNSGKMKPGDTFSVKFHNPGTYNYYCINHKGWMHGVVLVSSV